MNLFLKNIKARIRLENGFNVAIYGSLVFFEVKFNSNASSYCRCYASACYPPLCKELLLCSKYLRLFVGLGTFVF